MKSLLRKVSIAPIINSALRLCAVAGIMLMGVALAMLITPLRAQLVAQSTFIPAASVSYSSGSNAYSFTVPNVASISDLLGVPIRFIPPSGGANAAGVTNINTSGFGNEPVKRISGGTVVAIAAGDLSPGALAEVVWDANEFVLKNPATGDAPVGSEITFTGPIGASDPAGYLIENGRCISEATYAALYAYYGSTDYWLTQNGGSACSGSNFHLPFANGRAAVAADTQLSVTAGVLTSGGSGCAATAAAVGCGAQNRAITQSYLPNYNLSTSFSFAGTAQTWSTNQNNAVQGGVVGANNGGGAAIGALGSTGSGSSALTTTVTPAGTVSGTVALNGSGTAFPTVQPTYTIYKAVKY